MTGWEVTRLDDLDAIPVGDGVVWRPIRRRFEIGAFGTNAYTSEGIGKHVIEEHDELGAGAGGHQELYVVVRGRRRSRSTARPLTHRPARSSMCATRR